VEFEIKMPEDKLSPILEKVPSII